jgi:hypothetical protein
MMASVIVARSESAAASARPINPWGDARHQLPHMPMSERPRRTGSASKAKALATSRIHPSDRMLI